MSYDDRPYARAHEPKRLTDGLFWLLGFTAALHVLKKLLEGVGTLAEGDVERWMGVTAAGLAALRFWQPVTWLFVHVGVVHLVWTMLVVFFAGRHLEPLLGTRRFVGLYLVCGALGALGCLMPGSPSLPLVGAGSSIMAVLVVLLVMAPDQPVHAILFTLKMKWVVAILFTTDLCLAFGDGRQALWSSRGATVSYWTHVLGALAGFTFAWLWPCLVRPRLDMFRQRRERRRQVEELERQLLEERELDRILDKISREGMPSLTERERRFLERTSSRYHDSRRS